MIYAVIDTNVIVSALLARKPATATAGVLEAMLCRRIAPLYSKEILDEYSNVLSRTKFGFPQDLVEKVIRRIVENGTDLPRTSCNEIFPDPKDVVFYEVALSRKDSFLVTGNTKHFPNTPIVVTPAEMMEIINRNS